MINKIYVSYAWKTEARRKIVDRLEAACQVEDIPLLRDSKNLSYKDSIQCYMDELAVGDAVILVLCDDYFKSPYCMYELCELYQRPDFKARVFPMLVQGTLVNDAKTIIHYLRYWDEEAKSLQAEIKGLDRTVYVKTPLKHLEAYTLYRRLLDEILGNIGDWNLLAGDTHIKTDFAALLGTLKASLISEPEKEPSEAGEDKVGSADIKQQAKQPTWLSQKTFETKIKQAICRLLKAAHFVLLLTALYESCEADENETTVDELIELWWQDEDHLEKISQFNDLVQDYLARLSVKDEQQLILVTQGLRKTMGWLLLGSVHEDWLRYHDQQENPYHAVCLENVAGIEMITARLAKQPVKTSVNLRRGTAASSLRGDRLGDIGEIAMPETGWEEDAAIDEIGKAAWKLEFKASITVEGKKVLSEVDWKRLGRLWYRNKKYLAVQVRGNSGHPLLNDKICSLLRQKMGAEISIIRFGMTRAANEPPPLILDEGQLLAEIDQFLNLLAQYETQ